MANTYELKQISLARKNTDKVDADILCRILKVQVLSGEQTISPVTVPPVEIQELRALFSTYRLCKKQTTQIKNRIHSLLKERLYGFTQEQIFTQKQRKMIREIERGSVMSLSRPSVKLTLGGENEEGIYNLQRSVQDASC